MTNVSALPYFGIGKTFVDQQVRPPHWNRTAYRYFDNEDHAVAFAAGWLRVSTFNRCRKDDSSQRGDAGEGTTTYLIDGSIAGGGDDPVFVEQARRAGIRIGPNTRHITITDCLNRTVLPDSYLLCLTQERNDALFHRAFGKYCVEVRQPGAACLAIYDELRKSAPITSAMFGPVVYASRHFTQRDTGQAPIAFLKPADPYEQQKELRMVWQVEPGRPIEPMMLYVPTLKALTKLLK